MPRRLEQWMYPIDKTDLDVLRFAHFLALAAVTVRFLPKDWPGLKSPWLRPLILCGQHSLEIFCLGVFLAFAGHFVLAEVSGGAAMHFVISISGILIMCAVAWVISWYKRVADKSAPEQRAPPATPIWREGADEVQLRDHPGADDAGRSFDAPVNVRAEDAPQSCEVPGLPADHRERASEGRRCRKRRPAAEYTGGRQPFLDHQHVGGERLPRQVAGDVAGEAARTRSRCP